MPSRNKESRIIPVDVAADQRLPLIRRCAVGEEAEQQLRKELEDEYGPINYNSVVEVVDQAGVVFGKLYPFNDTTRDLRLLITEEREFPNGTRYKYLSVYPGLIFTED